MKINQLRILLALINHQCNISITAQEIHIAQSAISRHIQVLEQELGSPLFVRKGKKLVKPTTLCINLIEHIYTIERSVQNIRNLAQKANSPENGILRLATTHTQARFFLPNIITTFQQEYPQVELVMEQGSPLQLVHLLRENRADIAICTEAISENSDLHSEHCYAWHHCLVTNSNDTKRIQTSIDIHQLAKENLVTYSHQFAGGSHIRQTFAKAGITPRIVLAAADSDVIKTYVHLGLGVGIVAAISQNMKETTLTYTSLQHIFGRSTTRVAWRKDAILTGYMQRCINLMLQHGKILDNSV